MTLAYGGVEFGTLPNNWKFAHPDRTQDRPPRIEADLVFDSRADYVAFRALLSFVTWDRALGFASWTARVKAGHGADSLTLPSSGAGRSVTYDRAYLVSLAVQADAGHAGRYEVHAVWEFSS